jgi:hypothetical protein
MAEQSRVCVFVCIHKKRETLNSSGGGGSVRGKFKKKEKFSIFTVKLAWQKVSLLSRES